MARQLVIELVGKADKFTKTLGDADKASQSFGDKISSAGKKMTAFATVPIVGFLGAATKAAMDDAAAQEHLALTLKNVGETHKNVLGAVNDYISGAMKASTFTDDQLRPAFEHLVTTTGSAERAMDLMDVAMNVAAGKGIDLETATKAVAKAQEGQFAAVNKLVPGLVDLKDKSLTGEAAVRKLGDTFAGHAAAATETAAGKAQNMTRDLGEMAESIGAILIPIVTKLLDVIRPWIERFQNLDEKTQRIIVIVGLAVAAIGPLTAAVSALAGVIGFIASPIGIAVVAVAALAAGLIYAYKHSETFRNIVNMAFEGLKHSVKAMWNVVEPILNAFKAVLDRLIGPLSAVAGLAGKVGGTIGSLVGKIPGFANGGVVGGPVGQAQLALVHGGERITPYRGGNNGGTSATVVNVNVGGSIIAERDLGQVFAEAMRDNALYGIS